MKLVSLLLVLTMVHAAHATESALEPQKDAAADEEKPPKKTPGGFIELEIEGEEDKPVEPEAEQASADDSADNNDSGDSSGSENR